MNTNIEISLLQRRLEDQQRKNELLEEEIERMSSKSGDGGGPSDILDYRVTEIEKRFDKFEMKLDRIAEQMGDIQVTIAGLATRDAVLATTDAVRNTARNWGIGLMAIVIATGVAVGGLLLQSSSNQLAAFQAGLSAVATVAANQSAPQPRK